MNQKVFIWIFQKDEPHKKNAYFIELPGNPYNYIFLSINTLYLSCKKTYFKNSDLFISMILCFINAPVLVNPKKGTELTNIYSFSIPFGPF